jgi:isocitrate dehydrogenase
MSRKTTITVAHGEGIGPEIKDSYRRRFQPVEASASEAVTHAQISTLYQKVTAAGYDIVKTETLRTFDGQQGFTLAQGQ